jgi:hypothetical protein
MYTDAKEEGAHSEGYRTTASGRYSHAQGQNTTASGEGSHSEGLDTTASGHNSHAEGSGTIASSECQHVQGKFNVKDTTNTYAHIVGNGTYDLTAGKERRSNAHTLDWKGNAWYAGTVECTAMIVKSPGGKRFKITVDDSGTISATEMTE